MKTYGKRGRKIARTLSTTPSNEISYDFTPIQHLTSSTKDVGSLQRMIGNQATMQMFQPAPPKSLSVHQPVLGAPPDLDDTETAYTHPKGGLTIQRAIKPLPGKSSGWFRKGHRDKINELVEAYNEREKTQASGSKKSVEAYQALLPDIQKIWQDANAWYLDTMKGSPEKAAEIRAWMTNEVEREEDAKRVSIGELQQAAALKAAYDGASYNAEYATPDFTTGKDVGLRWLNTPAIAPIYEYHIIKTQHEGITLNAYRDIQQYKRNRSRVAALDVFDKYKMGAAGDLNITGEGIVNGALRVAEFRALIAALRADANAAAPEDFGPIEVSLEKVLNELFVSFRTTAAYRKVITPPPPPAAT